MRTFRRETSLFLLALLIGTSSDSRDWGAASTLRSRGPLALQALDTCNGISARRWAPTRLRGADLGAVLCLRRREQRAGSPDPCPCRQRADPAPDAVPEHIKPRTAVILSFALALEPGLAAISRQAGSPIMAVAFALAAWGLRDEPQAAVGGCCAGIALLSGPALWAGLLGLGITWALLRPLRAGKVRAAMSGRRATAAPEPRMDHRRSISLGSILLLGTIFMTMPGGMSAWLASLPEYIAGWTRLSDIPVA